MYLRDVIKNYLVDKNLEFREAGNEQYVFKRCVACGDDSNGKTWHHFYMSSEDGMWDCKLCTAKGNFNQFREFMGDNAIQFEGFEMEPKAPKKAKEYRLLNFNLVLEYASRLWSVDEPLVDYLKNKRQLNEDIIKEFKLGSNGSGIAIPIYEDGKLVNIRYRRDPSLDSDPSAPPRYSQEKGCKPALFNGDILASVAQVYITEGEFDAMQLIQRGLKNTVSVTLGAGYFPDFWVDKFAEVKDIFIVFDTDEEGRSGAKKVAEKLGPERCKLISLPSPIGRKKTDLTEYFITDGGTKDDFMELVKNAKSALVSSSSDLVKQLHEFNDPLRELLLSGEHVGDPTGYDLLDGIIGGMRKGRVIIVSGLTSVGKSSFVSNICLKIGTAGYPNFYFSMEMPPVDIAKKLLMLHSKLGGDALKKIEDPSSVLEQIDKTLMEFKGNSDVPALPIYLYNGSGVVNYAQLEKSARVAKEEYGIRCIFIDHLHYFAMGGTNVTAETSKIMKQIKQLAVELDLTVMLLTHINRGGRSKSRTGLYVPSLADLKDTSTIEQDADQVLFVCRDSENEDKAERQKAFIKVAKNRDGLVGPSVNMTFEEDTGIFVEDPPGGVSYEAKAKEEKDTLSKPLDEELVIPF